MMNTDSISIERVEALIDAYGSNTRCWPEEEREAALALMASTPALQVSYQRAQQLDAALLAEQHEEPLDEDLLARLVDNLPPQQANQGTGSRQGWWFGLPVAIAAGLVAITIVVGIMNEPSPQSSHEQLALQEIDYLLWQEVTDQASYDNGEDAPADFMSML